MFDSLFGRKLSEEEEGGGANIPPPVLKVVRGVSSLILIKRPGGLGEAGYWDQEKDMVVGPNDITLAFVDYFDLFQIPTMDFRYYRCKILSFPNRAEYEGRKALIDAVDGRVFHEE